MTVKPAIACPLCGDPLPEEVDSRTAVTRALGAAAPLYEHFLREHTRGGTYPSCPVCGFDGRGSGLGWSESFMVAVHWCVSQDVDEVDHVIRASLGELFLTQEVMK